jgi:hypothetical protein
MDFFAIARVPPEVAKQPPTVLVKWYDWLRWLLDRVDSFPKNQRFVFGTRLADRAIGVLEPSCDLRSRAVQPDANDRRVTQMTRMTHLPVHPTPGIHDLRELARSRTPSPPATLRHTGE